MNMLTSILGDSASNFKLNRINSTTLEVTFYGSKASDNAAKFATLSLNDLNQMDLASPKVVDPGTGTTTAAPEESKSNMAMIAGIAVGALVVIGGIGYLAYRKSQSSGSSGSKGNMNFNLDYDEEAFLGSYENEMNSMSMGGVKL